MLGSVPALAEAQDPPASAPSAAAPASSGATSPEAEAHRQRGHRLAREGRCEPALIELAAARAANPHLDTASAVLAGQCLVRLERYREALREFEIASLAGTRVPGLELGRAVAYYHLEEPFEAAKALRRAEANDPDRAELQLYKGLLELDRGNHEAGAVAFGRARALDAGYAEPVASFYEGLAYVETEDRDEAIASLERVVRDWPGTTWAEEAEKALGALERDDQKIWWVQATAGLDYDSNVALVDGSNGISRKEDGRFLLSFSAGVPLIQTDELTLGVIASYWGTKYFQETEFSADFPTISLWLDRRLTNRSISRFEYEYGFAWLDGDQYVGTNTWRASLFQSWDQAGTSRLYLAYRRDDFRVSFDNVQAGDGEPGDPCPPGSDPSKACGPPGLDESTARNRDSWAIVTGVEQSVPLADLGWLRSPLPSAGYEFEWVDSRGREWRHQAHSVWVAQSVVLPFELNLSTEARFTYRAFRDPTTFPDNSDLRADTQYGLKRTNRREKEWNLIAALERSITKNLSVSISWRYEDNDSTSATFDYHRHIVGMQLTGRLGP